MLRAATSVIAVSEFTAGEVETLVGIPREKIRVVPNAVDHAVFTPDGPRAEGDYVLAVGTLEPRKNLARTIAATARLGVELRVAGPPGWGGVDRRGDHVRWLGYVDDAELAALYRGARCFVYPSLYEGFGIPVLEAMACGAPVVTSRGGACEEIAGGAATLVDPLDVASIAAGIEAAVPGRGVERARTFTWDETARRTRAVYEESGMSDPLVVIDADVLGRRRTGDETYVENLLRALPAVGDGLRFAAITRRPDLVPPGVEPIELPARIQELRMALPRATPAPPPAARARALRPLACRSRCRARRSSRCRISRSSATARSWAGARRRSSASSSPAPRAAHAACSRSRSGRRTTSSSSTVSRPRRSS